MLRGVMHRLRPTVGSWDISDLLATGTTEKRRSFWRGESFFIRSLNKSRCHKRECQSHRLSHNVTDCHKTGKRLKCGWLVKDSLAQFDPSPEYLHKVYPTPPGNTPWGSKIAGEILTQCYTYQILSQCQCSAGKVGKYEYGDNFKNIPGR